MERGRGRARQAETHGQLHEQESWRESKQLGWEGHGIHISYIKDKHFISIFSEHRESLFKQSGLCWGRKSANSLCPCISKSIYCHLQQMHDMARLGFPSDFQKTLEHFSLWLAYLRLEVSLLSHTQGPVWPLKVF